MEVSIQLDVKSTQIHKWVTKRLEGMNVATVKLLLIEHLLESIME